MKLITVYRLPYTGPHKICIAMFVTLGIAALQKNAEDTLIGAELEQKMLWLVCFKIKRAFRILHVLKSNET